MVQPQVLRAFNDRVQSASSEIAAEDTGKKVATAADGIAGSTTQWACQAVGAHVAESEKKMATDVSEEGVAVRGAADRFEVADDALAGKFSGLFA